MAHPIEALMVGAGGRGMYAYGPYALAHPDEIRMVAVAEPDDARRTQFAALHGIPPERQFKSWQDALARPQLAQAALNCTQDRLHAASTLALLEAGYDVLLEKPMATTLADCVQLVQTAERHGRLLQICHVLRFTAFFSQLYEIVHSGRLGRIITVDHRENVSYWHMAHSFVRGHWRNEGLSSPMILAKCCHDLDILFWMIGRPARRLSSFGALTHYRAKNAPAGAPLRC
ncbi:MAG: Gfo/Idh/MocA family oxidoreductase, partial [Anaerolineae bacterium]|nr:Gfo/Idh/MocA family oxidoreductase [Thermoflexales bacterium]MDW8408285.1 Gfo/Idh/MocA family oxidoreductase [Anaerolineae bacterium]